MDRRGQGEQGSNAFSSLSRDLPLQRKGVLAPDEVASVFGKQARWHRKFWRNSGPVLAHGIAMGRNRSFCFCPGGYTTRMHQRRAHAWNAMPKATGFPHDGERDVEKNTHIHLW